MLRPVTSGPQVVVCSTCRGGSDPATGERGGALLAGALRARQAADPDSPEVSVVDMPCLFACARSCAVLVRAPGKISYVLGDFTPTDEAAQAILAYAGHYAQSIDGRVAYRLWPEGVKGHFITRMPPEGFVVS